MWLMCIHCLPLVSCVSSCYITTDRCSSSLDTFLDTSCALGMNLYSKEQSALDPTATGITR
jgi:hypothetical protein